MAIAKTHVHHRSEGEIPDALLDRWLTCFGPWARLILISAPYYFLGALFYSFNETKKCESIILTAEPYYDPDTCREPWTLIDGFYFTTVSMSTVGYGDLTATTPTSRAFTALWIMLGVVFVFHEIVLVFAGVIASLTSWSTALGRWVLRMDTPDGSLSEDLDHPVSIVRFFLSGIWIALVWFLAFQMVVAVVISYADPDLEGGDIAWYCFITATTVGYGDVNVSTQLGRLFSTFHVLLSVIWLAGIFGYLSELSEAYNRQMKHLKMLRRRLSPELIDRMDKDGHGVDMVEFLVESRKLAPLPRLRPAALALLSSTHCSQARTAVKLAALKLTALKLTALKLTALKLAALKLAALALSLSPEGHRSGATLYGCCYCLALPRLRPPPYLASPSPRAHLAPRAPPLPVVFIGCEIGGETLSWKHVAPITQQFRAFDVDNDGRLTHNDLQGLVELRGALMGEAHATEETARSSYRTGATPTGSRHNGADWNKMRAAVGGACAFANKRGSSSSSTQNWDDGTSYTGAWQDGQPSGEGKTVWADGSTYVGTHASGLPHGQGTVRYADGAQWVGPWRAGRKHGRGVKISPSGERDEGEWVDGERRTVRGQVMAARLPGRLQANAQRGKAGGARVVPVGGDAPMDSAADVPSIRLE